MEELRDFEEQMIAIETQLALEIQKNQQLESAREEDKVIIEDLQEQIRELNEVCDQYLDQIEQLEQDLLRTDYMRDGATESVIDKIRDIKEL